MRQKIFTVSAFLRWSTTFRHRQCYNIFMVMMFKLAKKYISMGTLGQKNIYALPKTWCTYLWGCGKMWLYFYKNIITLLLGCNNLRPISSLCLMSSFGIIYLEAYRRYNWREMHFFLGIFTRETRHAVPMLGTFCSHLRN